MGLFDLFKRKKELKEVQKVYANVSNNYTPKTAIEIISKMTDVTEIIIFTIGDDRIAVKTFADNLIEKINKINKGTENAKTPPR